MKRPTSPATTGSKAVPAGSKLSESKADPSPVSEAVAGADTASSSSVYPSQMSSLVGFGLSQLQAQVAIARYGGDEGGESKGADAAPTAVVPGKPNRADASAAHRTGDGTQGEEKQVVVDAVLLAKVEAGDVAALRALPWEASLSATAAANGWTPAHFAAEAHFAAHSGHVGCLRVLHGAGVSLSAPNADGQTPAHCAAMSGYARCLLVLQELGADACWFCRS